MAEKDKLVREEYFQRSDYPPTRKIEPKPGKVDPRPIPKKSK